MKITEKVHELIDPVEEPFFCKHGLQKWAAENAYTLTFIFILFVITWGFIVLSAIVEAAKNG